MGSLPAIRGTGLVAAVTALRADPEKYAPHLPDHLKHYLQERVDLAEWYPSEDLVALLQVFSDVELPQYTLEQRFQYYGGVAAHRDLEGTQEGVSEKFRTTDAGVWKGALDKDLDHAKALRRAFGMHQLYYEGGEFQLERTAERQVTATLIDFPAQRELCHLTLGYAHEVLKIADLPARVTMPCCRAEGDAQCQFVVTFRDDADVSDLLGI